MADKDCRFAAAYIRVSTEDQTDLSPDAQLREIRKYAGTHDMILDPAHVYIDEGISGRKASKRPAFQNMITAAKSSNHPFDVVLVHKFDRFARSREDSIVYKSLLQKCGVQVVSISESFDDGGSGIGMLMEAITEAYAEFYSVNLGREVKKGMTEKAMRGGLQSTPPYGYRVENHMLIPNPPEDEYVRQLFRRFADGGALFSLAKWMNAEGQKTHRGSSFENRTVEYILRNPAYIGKLRWNPSGRTRRDFNHPDIILADAYHQPLIDMELWEQVQTRMASVKAKWNYHKRPPAARKHWLCGLVRCSACGTTLIWANPGYLKCNNYVRGRCAKTQHIRIDLIEQAVLDRLRADAKRGSLPAFSVTQRDSKERSQTDLLQAQITLTERKLDRVRDAYLSGVDTIEEYKTAKDQLISKIDELKGQLVLAAKAPSKSKTLSVLRSQISDALAVLQSEDKTIAQKHEAAMQLIESCIWDKESYTLTVTYRVFI